MESRPAEFMEPFTKADVLDDHVKSTILDKLPDVVVGYILSLLPWPDRLLVSKLILKWNVCLQSTGAWQFFTTNYEEAETRLRLQELHQETVECVKKYGKYFQSCTIKFCHLDFASMGLDLLNVVSQNCINIKWLRLYHPDGCFAPGEYYVLHQYISLLRNYIDNSPTQKVMCLCSLDYVPVDKQKGFEEILNTMVMQEVNTKVRELEFTCLFSQPSFSLCNFMNLRRLKCPAQMLRTEIVITLARKNLRDLHIQSDGSTLDLDFREAEWLDWHQVASVASHLRVSYIFTETTVRETDLVPNPLVKTIVINSLCNSITYSFLKTIADLYGKTLQTFAHLALSWGLSPFENNYSVSETLAEFVADCEKLEKFVCGVEVDGFAPVRIADQGHATLRHLWFVGEYLQFEDLAVDWDSQSEARKDKLQQLQTDVSLLLGYRWKPLDLATMVLKTSDLISF